MRLCHVPTYRPIGQELRLTNDNLDPNRAFVHQHGHLHRPHRVEHESGKKIFVIPQKSKKYQKKKKHSTIYIYKEIFFLNPMV